MDQVLFEVGAGKLLNRKTHHGPNAVAGFSEGFSPTDISPRAIGITAPLALLRLLSLRWGKKAAVRHSPHCLAAYAIWPRPTVQATCPGIKQHSWG